MSALSKIRDYKNTMREHSIGYAPFALIEGVVSGSFVHIEDTSGTPIFLTGEFELPDDCIYSYGNENGDVKHSCQIASSLFKDIVKLNRSGKLIILNKFVFMQRQQYLIAGKTSYDLLLETLIAIDTDADIVTYDKVVDECWLSNKYPDFLELADAVAIMPSGGVNNFAITQLQETGHDLICLERDSFGWLIGAYVTKSGYQIVFG